MSQPNPFVKPFDELAYEADMTLRTGLTTEQRHAAVDAVCDDHLFRLATGRLKDRRPLPLLDMAIQPSENQQDAHNMRESSASTNLRSTSLSGDQSISGTSREDSRLGTEVEVGGGAVLDRRDSDAGSTGTTANSSRHPESHVGSGKTKKLRTPKAAADRRAAAPKPRRKRKSH